MRGAPSVMQPERLLIPTQGACMIPWIWPGGELCVRRCTLDQMRPGDIAVWFDGTGYRAHRVLRIEAEAIICRGDVSLTVDEPVSAHQLLGCAATFTRGHLSYRLDGVLARRIGHTLAPFGLFVAKARRTVGKLFRASRAST